MSARTAMIGVLLMALALGATACGRKGPPEQPPDSKTEFPRQYPR